VRGVVLVGSINLSLHLMLPDNGKGREQWVFRALLGVERLRIHLIASLYSITICRTLLRSGIGSWSSCAGSAGLTHSSEKEHQANHRHQQAQERYAQELD
jgi:hypothetical protein